MGTVQSVPQKAVDLSSPRKPEVRIKLNILKPSVVLGLILSNLKARKLPVFASIIIAIKC